MTLSPTATNYYIKEIKASKRRLLAYEITLIESAEWFASKEMSLTPSKSKRLIDLYTKVTDAKLTFKPVRK